jgi:hypothetical protein
MIGQKFPKKDISSERPSHQVIQIKLGAKFSSGSGLPQKQAPKTVKNKRIEELLLQK